MFRQQRRVGGRRTGFASLGGWAIVIAACSANHTGTSSSSGETHFLRACAQGCGEGLTCLCGLCTVDCTSQCSV